MSSKNTFQFLCSWLFRFYKTLVVAVCAVLLLLLVFVMWDVVIGNSRIRQADFVELLVVGRQVIQNPDRYVTIRYEDSFRKQEKNLLLTPELPDVIKKLKPSHISLGTNYMSIYLSNPSRTMLFIDGGGAARVIKNCDSRAVLIANGIWRSNSW